MTGLPVAYAEGERSVNEVATSLSREEIEYIESSTAERKRREQARAPHFKSPLRCCLSCYARRQWALNSESLSQPLAWAAEESLLRGRLPQALVSVEVRRLPAAESLGIEHGAVTRIVVAHRGESFNEALL